MTGVGDVASMQRNSAHERLPAVKPEGEPVKEGADRALQEQNASGAGEKQERRVGANVPHQRRMPGSLP